eukprot:TRINITY_DN1732_c0_g1_i2.p1 TRINITY_DN1732_c0_g1~~TRINITY_DN1732_c0_g1_i2.p1  ORF type:complete len:174 (-),score=42.53 TRINITY_DN1732_c0_g1_i2:22-543(-)
MSFSQVDTVFLAEIVGIGGSLFISGVIFSLSAFTVPILISSPTTCSLANLRWMFSRGSHFIPQVAMVSAGAFVYLAYISAEFHRLSFLAAAISTFGIGPFTRVMLPTNQKLKDINAEEKKGKDGVEKAGGSKEVERLMRKFGAMNYVRAGLTGAGGLIGLATALSAHKIMNIF